MYKNYNDSLVVQAFNQAEINYGEKVTSLFVVTEDNETFKIFVYAKRCKRRIDPKSLIGLTKREAIETVEERYYSSDLEGEFVD